MRSQLVSIRPEIPAVNPELESGEIERFQNETLRPILKFQNSLILLIFKNLLQKHRNDFDQLSEEKQNKFIENLIYKDRKTNHVLLGTVIGHFTDVECETYYSHEKELNRRITKMLIQRLQSQF